MLYMLTVILDAPQHHTHASNTTRPTKSILGLMHIARWLAAPTKLLRVKSKPTTLRHLASTDTRQSKQALKGLPKAHQEAPIVSLACTVCICNSAVPPYSRVGVKPKLVPKPPTTL